MSQPNKPGDTVDVVLRIVVVAVVGFFFFGGGSAVWKYLERKTSHEKLTKVHYHGEWQQQEYRECNSINSKEAEPELYCGDTSILVPERIFNVSFSGDITYDSEKSESEMHYWRCRRNDTDPAFSCAAKPNPLQNVQNVQQPQSTGERELTQEEIENLRKRNECEQRFYDKKIYQVDGMSPGAACKQNPNRTP